MKKLLRNILNDICRNEDEECLHPYFPRENLNYDDALETMQKILEIKISLKNNIASINSTTNV